MGGHSQQLRRWRVLATEESMAQAAQLAGVLHLQRATAIALVNRGITDPEAAKRFMNPRLSDLPDPSLLKDMDLACHRLLRALQEGERICIHGDYDVDGICGAALLTEFLEALGAKVFAFTPHRDRHGYGLTFASLKDARELGAEVLITADCGVHSVDEIRQAERDGISIIVTDHHEPPEELPPATALINPKRKDCDFPDSGLCGTGVAYYLAIGLRRLLREKGWFENGRKEPDLRQWLDLVAIATVGDIVPLDGINRVLVREGLRKIEERKRPGLAALLEVAQVEGQIRESTLSFRIIPRLNAAGRLGDAGRAVRLLLSQDHGEATKIAEELDRENTTRRAMEREIFEEACQRVDALDLEKQDCIVVYDDHWHLGVIGIVASRLVERYHRTTAIISFAGSEGNQLGRGSVRGVPGVEVHEALRDCGAHVLNAGGHSAAGGLSLEREQIEPFSAAFCDAVSGQMGGEAAVPEIELDSLLGTEELTQGLLRELDTLAPYGPGNPEPRFLLSQASIKGAREVGQGHLKLQIGVAGGSLDAIAFQQAHWLKGLPKSQDMAVIPEWNEWRGQRRPQLRVLDLQIGRLELL